MTATSKQNSPEARQSDPPLRVTLSAGLARTELDAMPKRVLHQLSARALREYACEVRAERNKYRSLYESHKAKADRLEQELADAREACRRMAAALRANVRVQPATPATEV